MLVSKAQTNIIVAVAMIYCFLFSVEHGLISDQYNIVQGNKCIVNLLEY